MRGQEVSGSEPVCVVARLQEPAVQLLYAPPGSDLVIAGTTKRQLLVWQYNPHAARRCGTHGGASL